jgi:hypothetical protein
LDGFSLRTGLTTGKINPELRRRNNTKKKKEKLTRSFLKKRGGKMNGPFLGTDGISHLPTFSQLFQLLLYMYFLNVIHSKPFCILS